MGMPKEDASERMRRELKERLIAGQNKELQNKYHINEFGEIVRDDVVESENPKEDSNSEPEENDMREVIRVLGQFYNAVSKRQSRWDKFWQKVKSLFKSH